MGGGEQRRGAKLSNCTLSPARGGGGRGGEREGRRREGRGGAGGSGEGASGLAAPEQPLSAAVAAAAAGPHSPGAQGVCPAARRARRLPRLPLRPPAPAPRAGPRGSRRARTHHAAAVPELDAGCAHAARGLPHLRRHLGDRRRNRVNSCAQARAEPWRDLSHPGTPPPTPALCAPRPPIAQLEKWGKVLARGGGAGGPGRFGERSMGARLPWGVPEPGARAASSWPASGSRLAYPTPPSLACPRAMSPGSREGAGECLGWAEGPRVEEAGVSLSPARPLSRLGKVGRGRAGISALGEGIPGLERRAGSLHWLAVRGVSPVPTDWHTILPPAREPGVRAPAGTARGGARRAGLRLSPSPGFGRSANPTAPPAPPASRALSLRRRDLSGKSVPPPGGLRGPQARCLARASLPISPEVGRDREPLPWRGTSRSAHLRRGTHPPSVLEAGTRAPPGSLQHARPGLSASAPQRASNPRRAGGEAARVLRGPEESFLAQGREKVRSPSGQKVPSSLGLEPSLAPYLSPAPRAPPPLSHLFHSLSARVGGPATLTGPSKGNARIPRP